jgi:hypothetical protein
MRAGRVADPSPVVELAGDDERHDGGTEPPWPALREALVNLG